jgi:uncharacterized protein (UPF0332 family)
MRRAISQAWLTIAEDTLAAANTLHTEGHLRSCVSRAYYAAYSFLASALVLEAGIAFRDDREGPEHEPLSDLVSEHLKKKLRPGVREGVRTGIRALYEARVRADYRPRRAVAANWR